MYECTWVRLFLSPKQKNGILIFFCLFFLFSFSRFQFFLSCYISLASFPCAIFSWIITLVILCTGDHLLIGNSHFSFEVSAMHLKFTSTHEMYSVQTRFTFVFSFLLQPRLSRYCGYCANNDRIDFDMIFVFNIYIELRLDFCRSPNVCCFHETSRFENFNFIKNK